MGENTKGLCEQMAEIEEYCKEHNLPLQRPSDSGNVSKAPLYDSLVKNVLQEGDILFVHEDRLKEEELKHLEESEIQVQIIEERGRKR